MKTILTKVTLTLAVLLGLFALIPASANLTPSVQAQTPALQINNSVDKSRAIPGEVLTYTLTVSNVSGVSVTNPYIQAPLTNVSYVSGSGSIDRSNPAATMALDNNWWNLGLHLAKIDPSVTYTIHYQGKVNTNAAENSWAQSTSQVSWDGQTSPIQSQADTLVYINNPSLCASISADKTEVKPGDTVGYTVTLCNQGNTRLNDILLTISLANGDGNRLVTYVPGTSTLTVDNSTIALNDAWMNGTHVNVGVFNQGQRGYVRFSARVNDNVTNGTKLETIAKAKSNETPSWIECASVVTVNAPVGQTITPRLNASKSVVWNNREFAGALDPSAHKYTPGEEVLYRIRIENPTDAIANTVRVEDKLTDSIYLDYVRNNLDGTWDSSTKTLTVNLGDIAAKTTRTMDIVFKVKSGLATNTDLVQRNVVTATSANAGSATAEATVTIRVSTSPSAVTTTPVTLAKAPAALPATGPETAVLVASLGLAPLGALLRKFKRF